MSFGNATWIDTKKTVCFKGSDMFFFLSPPFSKPLAEPSVGNYIDSHFLEHFLIQ